MAETTNPQQALAQLEAALARSEHALKARETQDWVDHYLVAVQKQLGAEARWDTSLQGRLQQFNRLYGNYNESLNAYDAEDQKIRVAEAETKAKMASLTRNMEIIRGQDNNGSIDGAFSEMLKTGHDVADKESAQIQSWINANKYLTAANKRLIDMLKIAAGPEAAGNAITHLQHDVDTLTGNVAQLQESNAKYPAVANEWREAIIGLQQIKGNTPDAKLARWDGLRRVLQGEVKLAGTAGNTAWQANAGARLAVAEAMHKQRAEYAEELGKQEAAQAQAAAAEAQKRKDAAQTANAYRKALIDHDNSKKVPLGWNLLATASSFVIGAVVLKLTWDSGIASHAVDMEYPGGAFPDGVAAAVAGLTTVGVGRALMLKNKAIATIGTLAAFAIAAVFVCTHGNYEPVQWLSTKASNVMHYFGSSGATEAGARAKCLIPYTHYNPITQQQDGGGFVSAFAKTTGNFVGEQVEVVVPSSNGTTGWADRSALLHVPQICPSPR